MTLLLFIALTFSSSLYAQKLKKGEKLPFPTVTNIHGEALELSNNTFLVFYRNVDCAMCNLRIHQLTDQAELFAEKDIRVIIVLQSSAADIKKHLGDEPFPFELVADPDKQLSDAIGARSGGMKTALAMRRIGSIVKIKKNKIPLIKDQRGDSKLAPVEFAVDGKLIIRAHYGSDIGDHLSIKRVLRMF